MEIQLRFEYNPLDLSFLYLAVSHAWIQQARVMCLMHNFRYFFSLFGIVYGLFGRFIKQGLPETLAQTVVENTTRQLDVSVTPYAANMATVVKTTKTCATVRTDEIVLQFCFSFDSDFHQQNSMICNQGRNRKIFLGGQSHFSWLFPGVKCFFPVENFHFRSFLLFWKVKSKKKKKKKKKVLYSFSNFPLLPSIFNFPPSLLQFSFFSSPFPPPLFPFFPCLFFPGRSAKISRSEVSGDTLPPPPACYATVCNWFCSHSSNHSPGGPLQGCNYKEVIIDREANQIITQGLKSFQFVSGRLIFQDFQL